jgi:hypothetical protein
MKQDYKMPKFFYEMTRDEMRMRDEDNTSRALQDVKYEMRRDENERSNLATPKMREKLPF